MQARRPSGREARERQDPSPSGKRHLLPALLPGVTGVLKTGTGPHGADGPSCPHQDVSKSTTASELQRPRTEHGASG